MANIGVSAVRLIDNDNDVVTVTNNKLDVNATLVADATIDIGDVDMFLDGGTAILGGAGAVAAGVLRVTIASDDAHFGEVGTSADNDGTIHGQLYYANIKLNDIESDTGTINTNINYLIAGIDSAGAAFATSDSGYASLAVRNDTLANLDANIADGDYSMLQVNDIGALYVTGESLQSEAVTAYGFGIMGEAKDIDGSALPNPVAQGEAVRIAMSRAGIQYTHLTNDTGTHSAILEEDSSHSTGDYGIMTLAVRANSLASLVGTDGDYTPLQVNASGALYIAGTVDLGSTDNGVLDAIASSLEILDDWDDSNYANVNINLAGSDAPTGGGAESGALRVTLANDSTGVISIDDGGNTITVDGTVSVNSHAVTNAGTFAVQAGHDITGMQSDNNEGVDDTTAEALGGSQACKRVDMQADPANTGYIYVGGSDVSATKGIRLSPGDFYSIDIDNVADIFVLASVDEEDIHFNYFT